MYSVLVSYTFNFANDDNIINTLILLNQIPETYFSCEVKKPKHLKDNEYIRDLQAYCNKNTGILSSLCIELSSHSVHL